MPVFCCITEQSAKTKQIMYSLLKLSLVCQNSVGILIFQELKHTIIKCIALFSKSIELGCFLFPSFPSIALSKIREIA